MDYRPGDVDLYSAFDLCGRFEIWIGPHELCLRGPGVSLTVERQDYPGHPEDQIARFTEILRDHGVKHGWGKQQ